MIYDGRFYFKSLFIYLGDLYVVYDLNKFSNSELIYVIDFIKYRVKLNFTSGLLLEIYLLSRGVKFE